jgi:eukaryotic-like serine/threonine-protein kinase
MIEPLTSEEIDEYLAQRGEHLLPLRTAIKNDPDLLKLATTPLMLTLLPLVYQNQQDIRALTSEPPTTWQDQILAHFFERMLQDPGMKTSYTADKTKRWLSWLAWQLTQRQQTELFLERMQPDWLTTDPLRQQYYGAVQLIVGMLVGGLVYGMISSYKFGLLTALRTGLEWVILSGVCLAFFNKRETEAQPLPTSFSLLWQRLYKKFAQRSVLVLAGIIFVFGLLGIVVKSGLGLLGGIDVSPLALALSGVALNLLLIGLLSTLLDAINPHIHPVEYVRWSWKALAQNVRKAIPIGCCFGVLIIFEIGATLLPGHGLDVALATALGGGLVIAFIGGAIVTIISGLASGLPSGKLDERAFVIPNQGIRRSAKNSVLVGVLTGLCIGLVSELIIALSLWPSFGWLQGLRTAAIYAALIGLLGGITIGLLRGGIACIQHFVLRTLLRVENYAPFNYPHFLHYAAGCNLLYRVGGGYMFFHPLLQDYLASQTSHYFPKLDTALPLARLMERDGHMASPLVSKKGGSSGRRGSVRASAKRARNK